MKKSIVRRIKIIYYQSTFFLWYLFYVFKNGKGDKNKLDSFREGNYCGKFTYWLLVKCFIKEGD